jgi:hypothetical protein
MKLTLTKFFSLFYYNNDYDAYSDQVPFTVEIISMLLLPTPSVFSLFIFYLGLLWSLF